MRRHPFISILAVAAVLTAGLLVRLPIVGVVCLGLTLIGLVTELCCAVVFALVWTARRLRHVARPTSRTPLRIAAVTMAVGMVGVAEAHLWMPSALPPTALAPSAELSYLEKTDQDDRLAARLFAVNGRDRQRRARVLALHEQGLIVTPHDNYSAALVLQHGTEPGHYRLANELAVVARDGGYAPADWLAKATYDRWLRSIGRPQVYGTQTGFSFEVGK